MSGFTKEYKNFRAFFTGSFYIAVHIVIWITYLQTHEWFNVIAPK